MPESDELPNVAALAKSALRQKVQRILDETRGAGQEATSPVDVGGTPHPTLPPVPLDPVAQQEEEELASAV
tara:strand:+ start:1805 stop:2017 length:213 start_codon:yes stop_codon:yes gene_type:complete